jgi:hypothetical protein
MMAIKVHVANGKKKKICRKSWKIYAKTEYIGINIDISRMANKFMDLTV